MPTRPARAVATSDAAVPAPSTAFRFPVALGALVDRLYTLRQNRLALQAQVDRLQAEETAGKLHLVQTFTKVELKGARGALASANLTPGLRADVTDRLALYKWVWKNQAFDLLQGRLNDAAYAARLAEGVKVPGVQPFKFTKVSITKR